MLLHLFCLYIFIAATRKKYKTSKFKGQAQDFTNGAQVELCTFASLWCMVDM